MLAEAEVHPLFKKEGREVLRHLDEGYVARVNVYRGTFPYALLEGPAQAEDAGVKPPFAEAKDGTGRGGSGSGDWRRRSTRRSAFDRRSTKR